MSCNSDRKENRKIPFIIQDTFGQMIMVVETPWDRTIANFCSDIHKGICKYFFSYDLTYAGLVVGDPTFLPKENTVGETIMRDGGVIVVGIKLEVSTGESDIHELSYGELKVENKDTLCSICMEDYVDNSRVKQLACKHYFHTKCINDWLNEGSFNCPICRSDCKIETTDDIQKLLIGSVLGFSSIDVRSLHI